MKVSSREWLKDTNNEINMIRFIKRLKEIHYILWNEKIKCISFILEIIEQDYKMNRTRDNEK